MVDFYGAGLFELPQNCTDCRSSHIGHRGEIVLIGVDFDGLGARRRRVAATTDAQEYGDKAFCVVADQPVVGCPKRASQMIDLRVRDPRARRAVLNG